MDILYIGTLPPHAGAAAILSGKILAGLSRRGHRVRAYAYGEYAGVAVDSYADTNPNICVTRYTVPGEQLGPLAWHSVDYRSAEEAIFKRELPLLLDDRRSDIVLLGREQYLWSVPEIVSRRGIPTVVVLHGSGVLEVMLDRQSAAFRAEFLENVEKVNHIIVVANHYREYMEGLGFSNVHHIPNGIEVENFKPDSPNLELVKSLALSPEDLVVLHASNLKARKRPLGIVDGAVVALEQDHRFRFVIVGDGPLLGELKEYARDQGVIDRFIFTGWIPRENIVDYYNLADMMLVTSEGEGQSLAQMEFQCCEGTLIVADTPGAAELVDDGVSGLLYKSGDPSELAARLTTVAGNAELRRRLGIAARSRILRSHTTDKMVTAYSELLEKFAGDSDY